MDMKKIQSMKEHIVAYRQDEENDISIDGILNDLGLTGEERTHYRNEIEMLEIDGEVMEDDLPMIRKYAFSFASKMPSELRKEIIESGIHRSVKQTGLNYYRPDIFTNRQN